MQDDPTVKDVLKAATELPKRVGKVVLETKVPVQESIRIWHSFARHWVAALLSVGVFIATGLFYMSQLDKGRYSCSEPIVPIELLIKPPTERVVSSAFAISPLSLAFKSIASGGESGPWDQEFDYKAYIEKRGLDISFLVIVSAAGNEINADELVRDEINLRISRCIADRSWITFMVVMFHAILAYIILLVVVPVRRNT